MVWQRNDDQYGVSRKVMRIPRAKRLMCVGLDQLAKNYSVRALTDGVLDATELEEVLATRTLITELVRVDMWHEAGHACTRCVQPPAGGIVIHDFLVYNPDAASVAASRADKSEGGKHGNHIRWHAKRGVSDPTCEWCATDDRSGMRSGTESHDESHGNPPGPVPVPPLDVTNPGTSSPDSTARPKGLDPLQDLIDEKAAAAAMEAHRLGISDVVSLRNRFEAITGEGSLTLGTAVELAGALISKSKAGYARNADAYLATILRDTPENVREMYFQLDLEGALR